MCCTRSLGLAPMSPTLTFLSLPSLPTRSWVTMTKGGQEFLSSIDIGDSSAMPVANGLHSFEVLNSVRVEQDSDSAVVMPCATTRGPPRRHAWSV